MVEKANKWYDSKWAVHILLIVFFPVGIYALWKSNTIAKWWKITGTVLVGLIVISNLGGKDKPVSGSREVVEDRATEWVVVYEFKGSGMKKSSTFSLLGNEARLRYSYVGNKSLGIGQFYLYVVDKGDDIMKTGGIPEVMSMEVEEEGESSIQKSAGEYYLNVNASGRWSVQVEEVRYVEPTAPSESTP